MMLHGTSCPNGDLTTTMKRNGQHSSVYFKTAAFLTYKVTQNAFKKRGSVCIGACYHANQIDQGTTGQSELPSMYSHRLRAEIAHGGGIQLTIKLQCCFCDVHVCFPKGWWIFFDEVAKILQ